MKRLLIVPVIFALVGCSAPGSAVETLTEQGYTNIETHGHAWFACSQDDVFKTKFTATSPSGHKVKGAVCKGWLKGSTIRFD